MAMLIFGLGFIGYELANVSLAAGETVGAIGRSPKDVSALGRLAYSVHDLSVGAFQAAWGAYDTWVILLPPSALPHYQARLAALVDFAQSLNIAHVVYTSSTSVFGELSGCLDEQSAVAPISESAKKIVAVEQYLLHSALLNVDVLRLGGLYAAQRHPIKHLLAKPQPLMGGSAWVNMVHRDAVIAAIRLAIATRQGKRLRHVVETPHLTRAAFYQREAGRLGLAAPVFLDEHEMPCGKRVMSWDSDWQFQAA